MSDSRPFQRDWPDWGHNGITVICYSEWDNMRKALIRHYDDVALKGGLPDATMTPTYSGYIYNPSDPNPEPDIPATDMVEGRLFSCRLGLPQDVDTKKLPDLTNGTGKYPFRVNFMIHPHAQYLQDDFREMGLGMACGWATRETLRTDFLQWGGDKFQAKFRGDKPRNGGFLNNMHMISVYRINQKDLNLETDKEKPGIWPLYWFGDPDWDAGFSVTRALPLRDQVLILKALKVTGDVETTNNYWEQVKANSKKKNDVTYKLDKSKSDSDKDWVAAYPKLSTARPLVFPDPAS